MEPIAFTTDKISMSFLLSALNLIQADEARKPSFYLNFGAPSCIILSCIAIEAFVNEVSSLTDSFINENKLRAELQEVANIRKDGKGSFYDRYKRLLRDTEMEIPHS